MASYQLVFNAVKELAILRAREVERAAKMATYLPQAFPAVGAAIDAAKLTPTISCPNNLVLDGTACQCKDARWTLNAAKDACIPPGWLRRGQWVWE